MMGLDFLIGGSTARAILLVSSLVMVVVACIVVVALWSDWRGK